MIFKMWGDMPPLAIMLPAPMHSLSEPLILTRVARGTGDFPSTHRAKGASWTGLAVTKIAEICQTHNLNMSVKCHAVAVLTRSHETQ